MRRAARFAASIVALFPVVVLAHGEETVAIIDLKFIKETQMVVAIMCYGDQPEDCGTWATGNLYEARLRKTIAGSPPPKKFRVIYGRHALGTDDRPNMIARLSKLAPDAEDAEGADYQVTRVGDSDKRYCFEWNDEYGAQPASGDILRCFAADGADGPSVALDARPPDDEASLRAANAAYNQALIDGNIEALKRILAEESIYTSGRGEVMDKSKQLAQFAPGYLDITGGQGSDEKVQIFGRVGVVTGQFDATGTYAGKPFEATERYTSTWVFRDGRWQLVAEQGTLVPKDR